MIINTYDKDGNIIETREVEGEMEVAEETKQIPKTALDNLSTKLNDPEVNSIAEIKSVLKDFIGEIQ